MEIELLEFGHNVLEICLLNLCRCPIYSLALSDTIVICELKLDLVTDKYVSEIVVGMSSLTLVRVGRYVMYSDIEWNP